VKRELLARIKARRAFLKAVGRKPRRRRNGRLPRQSEPRSVELHYFTMISRLLQRAQAMVRAAILPILSTAIAESAKADHHQDARGTGRINEAMNQVVEAYWRGTGDQELQQLAERMARSTSEFQRTQLGRQIQAGLGIELDRLIAFEPDLAERIQGFVSENVALIKSLPDRYFQEIERTVIAAIREGKRNEEVAADMEERYSIASSRATLIARDQIGKFYGELQQARQTQLGIDRYIWRTVRDNRVRPDHEEREGEIFAWDDPPEDGHPGEPIQCRCWAEPILDDILAEL
jgi:SPP1 gp7 family putative phage head morphogenesis protein